MNWEDDRKLRVRPRHKKPRQVPPMGERRRRFMQAIRDGYTFSHACSLAGIGSEAMSNVLGYGRELFERYIATGTEVELDGDDIVFFDLYAEYIEQRGLAAKDYIDVKRQAALELGDPNEAEWFLRVVFGKEFGYREEKKQIADVQTGGTRVTNILIVSPDEVDALVSDKGAVSRGHLIDAASRKAGGVLDTSDEIIIQEPDE